VRGLDDVVRQRSRHILKDEALRGVGERVARGAEEVGEAGGCEHSAPAYRNGRHESREQASNLAQRGRGQHLLHLNEEAAKICC